MNKEGWSKNIDNVKKGFKAFKLESEIQTEMIRLAINSKKYMRALHHISGYRAAAQEHLWKLWFYTFWPKRITIVLIMIGLSS